MAIEANKITPPEKQKTLEAFKLYMRLSGLLFDRKRDEIYNVTDIPEDNEFSSMAKNMAKELKVNWEKMTHAQSNRIMLAMLEDAFNSIRDIEASKNVTLKLKLEVNG